MSNRHTRTQSNLTLDQKVGTRASERYWPMLQPMGKDKHGNMQTREVYVDMHAKVGVDGTEKIIHGGDGGWSDVPPNLPSGDPGRVPAYQPPSQTYRKNYDLIDWSR